MRAPSRRRPGSTTVPAVHLLVAVLMAAAAPQKLGALGFSHANVADSVAEVAADHFAQQLAGQGFRVVTARELAALIGVERQKQLLGCADSDSSCLAELTNALGTEALVTGSLGRFGSRFTVNLKVTRASDGASLAVFSSEVGSEDELPATLSRAAAEIADQLRPGGRPLPLRHKVGFGIGYALAAALLGVGFAGYGIAYSDYQHLSSATRSTYIYAADAFVDRYHGESWQNIGTVFVVLGGAAALITSVMVMALGERASVGAAP